MIEQSSSNNTRLKVKCPKCGEWYETDIPNDIKVTDIVTMCGKCGYCEQLAKCKLNFP